MTAFAGRISVGKTVFCMSAAFSIRLLVDRVRPSANAIHGKSPAMRYMAVTFSSGILGKSQLEYIDKYKEIYQEHYQGMDKAPQRYRLKTLQNGL